MTMRHLQKWHGAGNDFLIDVQESADGWWNSSRVRSVCHRTNGVGADGLIVVTLNGRVSMTLYNADGSMAEMSGNGVRCVAAAVQRATRATWNSIEIDTLSGHRQVQLEMDGTAGSGSVEMGEVVFLDAPDGSFGAATIGNPHVVVMDQLQWSDSKREEMAGSFAASMGGANVEFLSVVSSSYLRIVVFERGVGWTQACGTGSCAVAALAHREGLSDEDVVVANPGGELRVSLNGAVATLRGPVQLVADVEWLEA